MALTTEVTVSEVGGGAMVDEPGVWRTDWGRGRGRGRESQVHFYHLHCCSIRWQQKSPAGRLSKRITHTAVSTPSLTTTPLPSTPFLLAAHSCYYQSPPPPPLVPPTSFLSPVNGAVSRVTPTTGTSPPRVRGGRRVSRKEHHRQRPIHHHHHRCGQSLSGAPVIYTAQH